MVSEMMLFFLSLVIKTVSCMLRSVVTIALLYSEITVREIHKHFAERAISYRFADTTNIDSLAFNVHPVQATSH